MRNGAKQCEVLTKRTRLRCQNPAAHGCRACRMHGAHKSRGSSRGAEHPQYKNGNETKEARAERSAKSLQFLMLEMIGWHVGLFAKGSTKFRGRKPIGFENLDLNDPDQLAIAILKSLSRK